MMVFIKKKKWDYVTWRNVAKAQAHSNVSWEEDTRGRTGRFSVHLLPTVPAYATRDKRGLHSASWYTFAHSLCFLQ